MSPPSLVRLTLLATPGTVRLPPLLDSVRLVSRGTSRVALSPQLPELMAGQLTPTSVPPAVVVLVTCGRNSPY